MDRTLVLLKPDAVARGLNFQITERFEKRGFSLVACRLRQAPKELAEAHYANLKGTPAFDEAVAFLTSGPMIATAWEAPNAVAAALATAGDSDPTKAPLGTVRGDLAIDSSRNLIECAADAAAAKKGLALWFTADELSAAPPSSTAAAGGKAAPSGGDAAPAEKTKAQLKKEAKDAKKAEKKGGKKKSPLEDDPQYYEPPSGTRDFFPGAEYLPKDDWYNNNMRVRTWLFNTFRETARRFAFQEYDAPVLEKIELWERKAGEEVGDQMYNFVDKEGHRVTLRPEMTPSLARMILSLGDRFLKPVKWFSIPQCWRFETVQRGRKREHYQWNMDIIGEASISAEVELLAAVTSFFSTLGITSEDVGIKVNSRKVLSTILTVYGVTNEAFASVCVIVDKLDKIGPEATIELLVNMTIEDKVTGAHVPSGLPLDAATKIVESLSLKSIEDLKELTGEAGHAAVDELVTLFDIAKAYGFGDWLYFDASVVRGLAYYTGIVFEGFDRRGELRAICGGGRYDELLTLYGSPETVPACGFGFGDCVIMELLKQKEKVPTLTPSIDFVVVAYNNDMRAGQVKRGLPPLSL